MDVGEGTAADTQHKRVGYHRYVCNVSFEVFMCKITDCVQGGSGGTMATKIERAESGLWSKSTPSENGECSGYERRRARITTDPFRMDLPPLCLL